MREKDLTELFIKNVKNTDFSSESKNKAKNLAALQAKLPIINEEREIYMRESKKRIRKPLAIAAIVAVMLSTSAMVFGAEIVNHVRTTMLGQHVTFVTIPESSDGERVALTTDSDGEMQLELRHIDDEELQAMIDAGEVERVVIDSFAEPNWLTFTNIEEGRSHFVYENVMLPTYVPNGFVFDRIFYFVETLEELEQYGANFYMGVVFSNGTDEIRMQIRYMTDDSGFVTTVGPDMRTMEINGHEAVLDSSMLSLLVDDVLYMFLGMGILDDAEMIAMAESLN